MSTSTQTLLLEYFDEKAIAVITLDDPAHANAMSPEMGDEALSVSAAKEGKGTRLLICFFGLALAACSADKSESVQAKIARAMSAGPPEIARSARVVDTDAQGKMIVLRKGNNGFTCMPGNPRVIGDPPMCADAASMQWAADFKAHKPKPTNTVPGITYMLAGATQRSDSDPYDTTSPPITVPPHWMIMWPFDPKATGLPVTHRDTGAYIMWAASPYAHAHIMGRP